VDHWESVGPGRGAFVNKFGGFVDMNSWIVDKEKLHNAFPALALGPFKDGVGDDRLFFEALKKHPHGETGKATSEYAISPGDQNFALRLRWFAEVGYDVAKISPAAKAMLIGSRPSASK